MYNRYIGKYKVNGGAIMRKFQQVKMDGYNQTDTMRETALKALKKVDLENTKPGVGGMDSELWTYNVCLCKKQVCMT